MPDPITEGQELVERLENHACTIESFQKRGVVPGSSTVTLLREAASRLLAAEQRAERAERERDEARKAGRRFMDSHAYDAEYDHWTVDQEPLDEFRSALTQPHPDSAAQE